MRVLQDSDILPEKPSHKNSGTLDWFLELSDSSEIENTEDLSNLPKVDLGNHCEIIQEGNYHIINQDVLEQLLGINQVSQDHAEQLKINEFIKKQTSFGEDFKKKFKKFPEVFYEAIEKEGMVNYKIHENGSVTKI